MSLFAAFVCLNHVFHIHNHPSIPIERTKNSLEIQSFLALANYYRIFVDNVSRITISLTRLTRKEVKCVLDNTF